MVADDFVGRIFCEDCIETMNRMPENYVDLVITSPPYGTLRDYNGFCFDFENIAKLLFKVVKVGGVVVWICNDVSTDNDESGDSFRQALFFKSLGFKLFDTMILHQLGVRMPAPNKYYQSFEYMFVFSKIKQPKTIHRIADHANKRYGEKIRSSERRQNGSLVLSNGAKVGRKIKMFSVRQNVWQIQNAKRGIWNKHPATFSERVVNDHMVSWSKENDIVYDPFMGSGTTAVVSIKLNRQYIGSEISQSYCDLAKQRIDDMQLPLFG